MKKSADNIKIYSAVLQEAHDSITPEERAAFELNFSISEKIYQILQSKGMTKRDLAKLTGKKNLKCRGGFPSVIISHSRQCR